MPYLSADANELRIGETLMATQDFPLIEDHAWEWGHVVEYEALELDGSRFRDQLGRRDSQEIEPAMGKAKILVMDDEQTIVELTQEMLSMLGYDVDIAKEGSEAVELYQKAMKTSHPYDLLIVDLVVPEGMGGKEVIERRGKSDPRIKAIVSSGYSSDPVMANYRQHGFTGVVSKPYTVQQLSDAVSQALGQRVLLTRYREGIDLRDYRGL
jgi:CheY-like chemotaxis protein